MTKLEKHLNSFTDRERAIYDYLLKGFTQAVDDLKQLSRDATDYQMRSTRIDDRVSNYAFTMQVLGIELNYNRHEDYKVTIELWR